MSYSNAFQNRKVLRLQGGSSFKGSAFHIRGSTTEQALFLAAIPLISTGGDTSLPVMTWETDTMEEGGSSDTLDLGHKGF